MASNKFYRIGYKLDPREKSIGKSGGLENNILKPNNNDLCPCGVTYPHIFKSGNNEHFTIPLRKKYKHCCRNKKIFIKNDKLK